jgi:NAD-dependent epimerase/dehydratase family protein
MKILIAGSHGMIGSAVTPHLIECGHQVIRLVRHTPGPGEVWWDPDGGKIDTGGLEGFDEVVHVASMPTPPRWTAQAKELMRANRLSTNRLLAESLAGCEINLRSSSVLPGWGTMVHPVMPFLLKTAPLERVSLLESNTMRKRPPHRQAKPESAFCSYVSRSWAAPSCSEPVLGRGTGSNGLVGSGEMSWPTSSSMP